MEQHPYFDLVLHDTSELANVLGSPITQRRTIHEWPLSCVQRLQCASGQCFIYKAQAPPTVEPAFYASAQSPLLIGAQILPTEGRPAALLFEEVQVPRLCDLDLSHREVFTIIDAVLSQIAQIAGNLPAKIDIRTEAQWLEYAQSMIADVTALVDAGIFQQVDKASIAQLVRSSHADTVRTAITGPTGYVHQDLYADNILVQSDGYKVLDWQRPIWGPVALDRAIMLESLGIAPTAYVPPGVIHLRTLLLIGWYAEAARYWFPAGAATYDGEIVRLVQQLEMT